MSQKKEDIGESTITLEDAPTGTARSFYFRLGSVLLLSGDILQKALNLSGLTVLEKMYDGSVEAPLNWSNHVLSEYATNEGSGQAYVATPYARGKYQDAWVGSNKSVIGWFEFPVLEGVGKDNYRLVFPTNLSGPIRGDLHIKGVQGALIVESQSDNVHPRNECGSKRPRIFPPTGVAVRPILGNENPVHIKFISIVDAKEPPGAGQIISGEIHGSANPKVVVLHHPVFRPIRAGSVVEDAVIVVPKRGPAEQPCPAKPRGSVPGWVHGRVGEGVFPFRFGRKQWAISDQPTGRHAESQLVPF